MPIIPPKIYIFPSITAEPCPERALNNMKQILESRITYLWNRCLPLLLKFYFTPLSLTNVEFPQVSKLVIFWISSSEYIHSLIV